MTLCNIAYLVWVFIENYKIYREPAISLHSHHVSLVQWTNPVLPITRDLGSIPLGVLM
jgi:hypothetical protein